MAWQLPLFGDEAFYWLESRHPAPAYDDVPGLTPWLIALSTALLGDAAMAIRLPGLLMSWATLWLLYRVAVREAGPETGWRVLLLASLPPMMGLSGVMMLPDVGINLAVLLCLYGAGLALRGDRFGPLWLAGGLLLGTLAHYRFVLPLAAAALAVLALPGLRGLLHGRVLASACLGLALGLAPVLWQMLAGDGQTLRFQFAERHAFDFQPHLLADPLLQAVVVSPLLYALLLWAGWRSRRATPTVAVFGAWGIALLVLIWLIGPWADSQRSRLHWPAPAYLALALPLGLAWTSLGARLRAWTLGLGALVCTLGAVYLTVVSFAASSLAGSRLYPDNFVGAGELAAALAPRLEQLPPGAPLAVDHFLLAAQLEQRYAAEGSPRPVFVLDHPHNFKHGRQRELSRMGRDARALDAVGASDGLVVIEPAALTLRDRPAWLWTFCLRHPHARWSDELWSDRGDQRLALFRLQAGTPGRCEPPVVGYIDLVEGARVRPGQTIGGWAIAGGSGVSGLRLRVSGAAPSVPEWPMSLPSLAGILGETGDPSMPDVGWQLRLPDSLPHGRFWLQLEARTDSRDWHPVIATPVERSD
nr:glycosyltransferase family 39 protein [Lysobacter sp. CAU 1642]